MKIKKLRQSNLNGTALKLKYWNKFKVSGQCGTQMQIKIVFMSNQNSTKNNKY